MLLNSLRSKELNDCVFQANETKLIKFPSYSKLNNEDNFLKN